MSGYLSLAHCNLSDPALVPVLTGDMIQKQYADHFCRDLVARLPNGNDMSVSQIEARIFLHLVYEDEQIVVAKSLQAEGQHHCHYANPLGRPADKGFILSFDVRSTGGPCL